MIEVRSQLRDRHVVRAENRPDYVGETLYYWDSASKRVEYLYIENLGGLSRGTMESAPGALTFPPAQYVEGGETMTYRARWSFSSDKAYQAVNEIQTKDGWKTAFKLDMQQSR